MDVKQYQQLKRQVEQLQSQADRDRGVLDRLKEQLQTEYKCSTLKQANQLLKKLEKDRDASAQEFETALDEFQEQYSNQLGLDSEDDD